MWECRCTDTLPKLACPHFFWDLRVFLVNIVLVCDLQLLLDSYIDGGVDIVSLGKDLWLSCINLQEVLPPWAKGVFQTWLFQNHSKECPDGGEKGIKPGSQPGITAQWGYSQNVPLWLSWHSPGPSCAFPLQKSTFSFLVFPFQLFIAFVILKGSPAQAARQAACNNRGTKPAQEISWFD